VKKFAVFGVASAVLLSGAFGLAATQASSQASQAAETEQGIPVTDPLVIEKCGACHTADEKGNLSRISWTRTTPEGWAQAIRRMSRQHGLQATPAEIRSVIKYLSNSHGLAPEEAKPVMYMPEHRIVDETLIPNNDVRQACASCHAFGLPMSWRRSKAEWQGLRNFHVALYAQAEAQFRGGGLGPEPEGKKKPGDVAFEFLNQNATLHTPQWAAWRSRIRQPELVGRWLVSASVPGQGKYVGEMVVEQAGAPDEFKTTTTLRSLKDGATLTRTGTGLVYSGYSWRGRSAGPGRAARPDDLSSEAREVLWIAPNQASAEGRWFWGAYSEFGYDVKLTRATSAPSVVAVTPGAVKAGSTVQLRILGDNFPQRVAVSDISLGAGVTPRRIVSQSAKEIVVEAQVAAGATSGDRDVAVAGAALEKAFPVYSKVDFVKVTPETAMARLGSDNHPRGYQQFEAIGYENGPDGKSGTADDLALGPIDVTWTMDEFMTIQNDDDTQFVGQLSPNAFFTPAQNGPNPRRKFMRNNYGDVWVTATAKSEKDAFGRPLTGRAYLVVTVPLYQRWEYPELSR
jgi:quinohemoprotein amine dehydrogenase